MNTSVKNVRWSIQIEKIGSAYIYIQYISYISYTYHMHITLVVPSRQCLFTYTTIWRCRNQPITAQLLMKAVPPLAKILVTAHHMILPDGLGQVKLPVGQVDLGRILFYIIYCLYRKMQHFGIWANKKLWDMANPGYHLKITNLVTKETQLWQSSK